MMGHRRWLRVLLLAWRWQRRSPRRHVPIWRTMATTDGGQPRMSLDTLAQTTRTHAPAVTVAPTGPVGVGHEEHVATVRASVQPVGLRQP